MVALVNWPYPQVLYGDANMHPEKPSHHQPKANTTDAFSESHHALPTCPSDVIITYFKLII